MARKGDEPKRIIYSRALQDEGNENYGGKRHERCAPLLLTDRVVKHSDEHRVARRYILYPKTRGAATKGNPEKRDP
jgi:hypothetical protein